MNKRLRLRSLLLALALPSAIAFLYVLADWTDGYSRAAYPGVEPASWFGGLPMILLIVGAFVIVPLTASMIAATAIVWILKQITPGFPHFGIFLVGGLAGTGTLWLMFSSVALAALLGFLPSAVTAIVMYEASEKKDVTRSYDNT